MKKVCVMCVLSCVLKTTLQGQPLLNWTKQTHSRWTNTLFYFHKFELLLLHKASSEGEGHTPQEIR